jgi:hypothetical protein
MTAHRRLADRAAVIATAITQIIFSSPTPRDLRAQIEALLLDELHDVRRELIGEIRTRLYE